MTKRQKENLKHEVMAFAIHFELAHKRPPTTKEKQDYCNWLATKNGWRFRKPIKVQDIRPSPSMFD